MHGTAVNFLPIDFSSGKKLSAFIISLMWGTARNVPDANIILHFPKRNIFNRILS